MLSLAFLLIIVIDPFGNMIAVNAMLKDLPPRTRLFVILRESIIAFSLLLMAALVGSTVLQLLGLDRYSLSISGGIVLFLIALGMLFPNRKIGDESTDGIPLIVPIAMPLIAGPSAISMVILFAQNHPKPDVVLAVFLSCLVSTSLLAAGTRIFQFLGVRGSMALERLMGMLLILISVQMILDGIDEYREMHQQPANAVTPSISSTQAPQNQLDSRIFAKATF
ncbi:MarC family protein [Roseibacillus persicicus]|uniref:UPF0056 membrane protein n=1 Tax=Roseibacillus persicicus TaxID=454148 RepID=A0A918WH49_9BACT|nr:MarC family protein [Roseibacillus persicicus]GHC46171.1 UPF0056 inner membrane protein [Roseibacillus persicicus]